MSEQRDLEFLYEIGSLRFIPRSWKRFLNPDFENLAEHHMRVMWIALIIAKHEDAKDTAKLMKMALVHDITESRTGDADYLSRQYVERNEKLGIEDMLKDTALEAEFLKLWHEYEDRVSLEAKIVKDADNLSVDFELKEQEFHGLNAKSMFQQRMRKQVKQKYYTKTAKKMFDAIADSNPHDWHINSRNRINAGDWKAD